MKQRRLSLLLVIALLVSVLVPSFALAADAKKPTVTIANKDYTTTFYYDKNAYKGQYLSNLYDEKGEPLAVTFVELKGADMDDLAGAQLYWSSSDTSIVTVAESTGSYSDVDENGDAIIRFYAPSMKLGTNGGKAGTATIKATKLKANKNGQNQVIAMDTYPSFTVTLKPVELKTVALAEDAQKEASFDIEKAENLPRGIDLSGYAKINFEPDNAIGAGELEWKLTEGEDVAKLWARGVLYPQKAGKAVVTVSAKSKPEVKQTFTFNITDEKAAEAEAEEPTAGTFEFTASEFTINLDDRIIYIDYDVDEETGKPIWDTMNFVDVDLTLDNFLTVSDDSVKADLRWDSSNPELAPVDYYTGMLDLRAAIENARINYFAKGGDKVTIKATSYIDPSINKSVVINFVENEEEEEKLVEKIDFVPATVSIYHEDFLPLDDYLKITPSNVSTDLTYTVDKPEIAKIARRTIEGEDGDREVWAVVTRNGVDEGTVVVTASDAKSGVSGKITVTFTKYDESICIGDLAFTPKTLNVYSEEDDYLNLWKYLRVTAEPKNADWWNNGDKVVFSVSDASVAEVVDQNADGEFGDFLKFHKSTGKVTVAATSFFKEITDTIEINIIGDSEPVKATSLKFVPRTLSILEQTLLDEYDLNQYLKIEPTGVNVKTDINWSIDPNFSDANVATINSHGYAAFSRKPGKVRFVALDKNSELYDFIDVTVVAAEESTKVKAIAFAPAEVTVDTDSVLVDLDAYLKVEPLDAADYTINYVSSDTKIASIDVDDEPDENGEFHTYAKIKKSGIVKITATVKDQPEVAAATLTLVIKDATVPFDTLKFAGVPTTAYVGDELDLRSFLTTGPKYVWGDDLVWTSSNQQVAAVLTDEVWKIPVPVDPEDEDSDVDYIEIPVTGGRVEFLRAGTVTITVRSKLNAKLNAFVTFEVKENSNPIQTITVTQDTFTLKTYDFEPYFFQRYLVITPADYDDDLVWTSSDPEVVSVERSVATLGKPGTAKVTVRSLRNPAATASFTVVHEAEALKSIAFIADTPKTLNVTDDMQLTEEMRSISLYEYITTDPWYYAYSSDIVFASSDPQIASVNEDGILQFHKAGKVTITASYVYDSAVAATTEIERKKVNPTAIKFVKNDIVIATGETIDLGEYVTLEPFTTDYSIDDIRWQVVDTDVADWLWVPDVDDEEEIVNWDNVEWYQLRNEVLHGNEKGETKVNAMLRLDDGSVITGSLNVTVKDYAVEKLAFAKKNYKATFKYDDDTIVMKFNVTPIDATLTRKDLRVNTSKATVAKIVDYGVEYNDDGTVYGWVEVRPLKPGTSKITVSLRDNEKIKATAKVTIDSIAVKRIKLPKKTLRMYFYELNEDNVYQNVYHLKSFIQPYNAYAESITWETTDASVCFVNNLDRVDGVPYADLIATGAGSATITLKVDDGKKVRTQTMKVVVSTKTVDLKLNAKKATINMIKGGDNTFQLEAFDAKSEEAVAVKWKSSNKKVATVDKNGLVTAKKAGTAVITATTKDGDELTASCNVTVNKLKVTSIKAKKALSLKVGAEADLTIKVKPADAFNSALKFASSDSSVLYVNKAGHIEAKKAGTAVITVKTTDGSKLSLEITVTVTK